MLTTDTEYQESTATKQVNVKTVIILVVIIFLLIITCFILLAILLIPSGNTPGEKHAEGWINRIQITLDQQNALFDDLQIQNKIMSFSLNASQNSTKPIFTFQTKPVSSLLKAWEGTNVSLVGQNSTAMVCEFAIGLIIGTMARTKGRNIDKENATEQIGGQILSYDLKSELHDELHAKNWSATISNMGDNQTLVSKFIENQPDFKSLEWEMIVNETSKQKGDILEIQNKFIDFIIDLSKFSTVKPGDLILIGLGKRTTIKTGDRLKAVFRDKSQNSIEIATLLANMTKIAQQNLIPEL